MISTEEIEVAVIPLFGNGKGDHHKFHSSVRTNIMVPNISWGLWIHECDLLIIRPSGHAIEVEIKRSKSDLKADFNKKHQHKSKRIKQLYYAIPEELRVSCEELIPENAGLIIVDSDLKAFIVKEAPMNKDCRKLTDNEIATVCRLGCMRIWGLKKRITKNK